MTLKDTWTVRLKDIFKYARRTLVREGVVNPLFVMYSRTGERIAFPAELSDDDNKAKTYGTVRALCTAEQASGLAFISEAWVAHEGEEVAPSESPTGVERLIAWVMFYDEADERVTIGMEADLVRDESGVATGITKISKAFEDSHGPLIDVLPAERVSENRAAMMRSALKKVGMDLASLRRLH